MRIRITVTGADPTWVVTTTAPDDVTWAPAPRTLQAAAPGGYPRSQNDPLAAVSDQDLHALQQNILFGDGQSGDVAKFGDYLFQTLLGTTWDDAVARFPDQDLDLELVLPADNSVLHRLPWEMMFTGGQPLVARAPNAVSITRIVNPPAGLEVTDLEIPMRLLFVTGKLDERLRPGAEYVALLRQLGSRVDVGNRKALGAALHVRLLLEATSTEIEAMAESFKPHVVHLVAHGRRDVDEDAVVVLTRRQGTQLVESETKADQLVGLLRGSSRKVPLPHLVVVNACDTANPGDHLPFAASLVANGVPAAVGMSGEVQDAACHVFTAGFYRALTEQRSVAQATSSGQRAALLHYAHQKQSVEWGRPALFLAAGVTTRFIVRPEEMVLVQIAAQVRGQPPMLCGQYRAFRRYEEFIAGAADPASPRLLAFEQTSDDKPLELQGGGKLDYQVGKSRLLAELEWLSLLDGFLPCYLPAQRGHTIANHLLLFAILLAESMDRARKSIGGGYDITSSAQRVAFNQLLGDQAIKYAPENAEAFDAALSKVKQQLAALGPANNVDPDAIGKAIRRDIGKLVADARALCPKVRGALVLLDDLHRYEGVYEQILRLIDDYGLGTDVAPAPVVLTYSPQRNVGGDVRAFLTNGAERLARRTVIAPLDAFKNDAEGQIAYAQYLQTRRFTPRRSREGREAFERFVRLANSKIRGVPAWLPVVEPYIEALEDNFAPIDEAAILGQMNAND